MMQPGDLRVASDMMGTSTNIAGGASPLAIHPDLRRCINEDDVFILLDNMTRVGGRPEAKNFVWKIFTRHGIIWSYEDTIKRCSREA